MVEFQRVARAAAYLVGVAALAGVVGVTLTAAFSAVGLPDGVASPVAIAAAVAVALAVADVYTPIGRGPRSDAIGNEPHRDLAVDVALAGSVAVAVSAAFALAGLTVWPPLGNELLVLLAGIGAGYAAFMLRNREFYLDDPAR